MNLLRQIREFLGQRGVSAYVVGGYLRDVLLGRPAEDIDLAVLGDAYSLGRDLAHHLKATLVPLDLQRGILRLVLWEKGADRSLDLTSVKWDIRADLARRDFTINAMAVPLDAFLRQGWRNQIVDPFHGQGDLERRVIRVTGAAVLEDDPLRLLRAIRLASALDFTLEADTRAAVKQRASLLSGVAPERQRDELLRLLAQPKASRWIYLMDELGLLVTLVPELEEGRGVEQPQEHHWDVLAHNIETVEGVECLLTRRDGPAQVLETVPWGHHLETYFNQVIGDGHSLATLVKLAGLLHDVAKPATKRVESNGRIRFFGHHRDGARMAEAILQRLRLSHRSVELVGCMIENHLRPGQMAQGGQLPTPRAIYRYYRDLGDAAVATLYLNLGDFLAARGPSLELGEWRRHVTIISHILQVGREARSGELVSRLVDGHDLMGIFGLEPGPALGRLLEVVEEAQGIGEIKTRVEALALVRRLIQREGVPAG